VSPQPLIVSAANTMVISAAKIMAGERGCAGADGLDMCTIELPTHSSPE
jgi:hypothetical protein